MSNGTKVKGSVLLSVKRARKGWRVLVTFEIAGQEVVHFGPEYASQDAALSSLEGHAAQVLAHLKSHGLKCSEPEGFA